MSRAASVIKKYPLLDDQIELHELRVLLAELEKVLENNIEGDVVEFGCYEGATSVFLQRMLEGSGKKLWLYDSFDGLPEKSKPDQSPIGTEFKRGELKATKPKLIENFRKSNLPLPIITKKWFHEVESHELPDNICFALLDGDYYKSIRSSLDLVLPRMSKGGIIAIDDYDNPKLPGVQTAIKDSGLANDITIVSHIALLNT